MSDEIEVHGFCDQKYLPVREAFQNNFAQGRELGASLAVTEGGRPVVDLWAGYMDVDKLKPWEEDTLVIVFSTTKIMTSMCAWILIDRGLLELDTPIARYWPEFAQNGKENVLVKHIFDHSTGLPAFDEPVGFDVLLDWGRATSLLEHQEPWWEPGTQRAYHAMTYGYLLGEVVRRISGQSVGTFLRTEVAERIDADVHIGLPARCRPRLAEISSMQPMSNRAVERELDDMATRIVTNLVGERDWASEACHAAEIPSNNGHGNARSLARMGSVVAMRGEVGDVRLLSPSTVDLITEELSYLEDPMMGARVRFGLGVGLNSAERPFPNPNTVSWGGYGGSFCMMDVDAGVSCAYAMNNLMLGVDSDPRQEAIYDALFPIIAQT